MNIYTEEKNFSVHLSVLFKIQPEALQFLRLILRINSTYPKRLKGYLAKIIKKLQFGYLHILVFPF